MKKLAMVVMTAVLFAAVAVPVTSAAANAPRDGGSAPRADTVSGATPNYRTFLKDDAKGMPEAGGSYTCLKAQAPFTYFTQEWYGVKLSYLLDVEVGLKEGTTAIKVLASDGYSVTLTLDELRDKNPKGLYTMLAWKRGEVNKTGGPYQELDEREGPLRLIVPQEVIGPHNTGTPNWNKAVQMVRDIEVHPTPPGLPSVEPASVPPGEIVVYGNILNRRSFTVDRLKSIARVTGSYHWKNTFNTEGNTTFTGIPLDYLLERVVGIRSGTTGASVIASDSYTASFTTKQLRASPNGLDTILAWNEDGKELAPEPGSEGPLKVVRPQVNSSDVNKSDWVRNTRVVRVDPAGTGPVPSGSSVPSDRIIVCGNSEAGNVPDTWYLAEGYTGGGFEEFICIANPNSWKTRVTIEYMVQGEDNRTQQLEVPARSRATVRVNDVVGDGKNVSAKVQGYHGDSIVAERAMYWNGRAGGHCATGVTAPGGEWYMAEGSTAAGFETWVLLQNPGDDAAKVTVTYMNETGEKPGPVLDMAPHSRTTVNVADTLPGDWQVSTKVTSDQPVIAERAMYWNGRKGGHCENAVDHPKFRSILAEGSTAGGFETWVLLQNPGPADATVYITYLTGEGAKERPAILVPAGTRMSINEANDVGENYQVSLQVNSTAPVAVERAVYWFGRLEGSCSRGYEAW